MGSLSDFLLARISDDEALAQSLSGLQWGVESTQTNPPRAVGVIALREGSFDHAVTGFNDDEAELEHIARHDPARVLAECAAKRAIVEMHAEVEADRGGTACGTCDVGSSEWIEGTWPCHTILALATIHADHPDFDPAWRPEAVRA